jgi:hypothetical protein
MNIRDMTYLNRPGYEIKTEPPAIPVDKGVWYGWIFCKLAGINFSGGSEYNWKTGVCKVLGDFISEGNWKHRI